jgi:threonine synthase
MSRFGNETLSVTEQQWQRVKNCFDSASVDDDTTCAVIAEVFKESGKLLDPHTAVGVKAGRICSRDKKVPVIILATAHPAKFSEAIAAAGLVVPKLPGHLSDLFEREERYTVVPNEIIEVTNFIKNHFRH